MWTLTPGAETRAEREFDAANVAEGSRRVQLASRLQYSMPGAPTVFYGDEVGLTGDDDPDDRRTYPWADRGGSPDTAMLAHYQALGTPRADRPELAQRRALRQLMDGHDLPVAGTAENSRSLRRPFTKS